MLVYIIYYANKNNNTHIKYYNNFISKKHENYILIILLLLLLIFILTYLPVFNKMQNINISLGYSFYNKLLLPLLISIYMYIIIYSIKQSNSKLYAYIYILQLICFFIIYKYNLISIEIIFINLAILAIFTNIITYNKDNIKMFLSHNYLFILTIVIALSTILKEEIIETINLNSNILFNNYNLIIKNINYYNNLNYNSNYFTIAIEDIYNKNQTFFYNEKKVYFINNFIINKSCIYTNIFNDIYVFIGDGNYINGWYLRVIYQPFVSFI